MLTCETCAFRDEKIRTHVKKYPDRDTAKYLVIIHEKFKT